MSSARSLNCAQRTDLKRSTTSNEPFRGFRSVSYSAIVARAEFARKRAQRLARDVRQRDVVIIIIIVVVVVIAVIAIVVAIAIAIAVGI